MVAGELGGSVRFCGRAMLAPTAAKIADAECGSTSRGAQTVEKVHCRGEQCSPGGFGAISKLHGRTLCAPTTQLPAIFLAPEGSMREEEKIR